MLCRHNSRRPGYEKHIRKVPTFGGVLLNGGLDKVDRNTMAAAHNKHRSCL